MLITYLICILGAICAVYIVASSIRASLAEFAIRRTIKQFSSQAPNGRYEGFSLTNPRACFEIEGYEVKCGASISHNSGGLMVGLFEKVKLKNPPHVPWPGKDSLYLNLPEHDLSLEWGWLTRYRWLEENKLPNVVSVANKTFNDTAIESIKLLLETATRVDSGCLDIEPQISAGNNVLRRDYLIGILVVIVVVFLILAAWTAI